MDTGEHAGREENRRGDDCLFDFEFEECEIMTLSLYGCDVNVATFVEAVYATAVSRGEEGEEVVGQVEGNNLHLLRGSAVRD